MRFCQRSLCGEEIGDCVSGMKLLARARRGQNDLYLLGLFGVEAHGLKEN